MFIKSEIRKPKSETNNQTNKQNKETVAQKSFDLEDRTLVFAKSVRVFVKRLPRSTANYEDTKQLVRSSGSVGANYIEANESLGKKDFAMRIRISRKEAKESIYWLKLVDCENNHEDEGNRTQLIQEATELMKIFGSILKKTTGSN